MFELAWKNLIQRFENFLEHTNKDNNTDERGVIIPDNTNGDVVKKSERKMRRINYIPSKFYGQRNIPIHFVIEDPFFKDSAKSSVSKRPIWNSGRCQGILYRRPRTLVC